MTDGGVPDEEPDETDEKPFPRAIYGPCPICEGVINSHPFECEDCGFRPYMSDRGQQQDETPASATRQLTPGNSGDTSVDGDDNGAVPQSQSPLFEIAVTPTGRQTSPTVATFELTATTLPQRLTPPSDSVAVRYGLEDSIARPIGTSLPGRLEQLTHADAQSTAVAVVALLDTYASIQPFVKQVDGLRSQHLRAASTTEGQAPAAHQAVGIEESSPHPAHAAVDQALSSDITTETRRRAIQRALAHLDLEVDESWTAIAFCHVWAAAKHIDDRQRCVALLRPAWRALAKSNVPPTGGDQS
jgi:hypothetical protein